MWLVQGHTAKWIAKQRLNPGTLASELMLLTTTQSCLISTGRSSGLHSLRGSGSLSVLLHSREHRVCLNPLAPLGQRLLSWFPFPTIFLTLLSCKNYSQLEESFASSLGFGLGPQKAWSFMNAYDWHRAVFLTRLLRRKFWVLFVGGGLLLCFSSLFQWANENATDTLWSESKHHDIALCSFLGLSVLKHGKDSQRLAQGCWGWLWQNIIFSLSFT